MQQTLAIMIFIVIIVYYCWAAAAAAGLYLEDGNPGQSDVVERYGAVERIAAGRLADSVVFVPVDAAGGRHGVRLVAEQRPGGRAGRHRPVDGVRQGGLVTSPAAVDKRRYLATLGHAAVGDAAADEIAPVLADVIVHQIEPATESRPAGRPASVIETFEKYIKLYSSSDNDSK